MGLFGMISVVVEIGILRICFNNILGHCHCQPTPKLHCSRVGLTSGPSPGR